MKCFKGSVPKHRFLGSMWTLSIDQAEDEVEQQTMEIERADRLQIEVDQLTQEKEKLKDVAAKLEEETVKLHRKASVLSDKLHQGMCTEIGSRARSRSKSIEDYSVSHRRRLKRTRTLSCENSLTWLQMEGYTPTRIELVNNTTGKVETVHLASNVLGCETDSTAETDIDILNMMLLVKVRITSYAHALY